MENVIKLEVEKTISRLAGNKYGKDIYENQVKKFININEYNVIIIPDTIEDIAISFVQGFTSEIFEQIENSEEDYSKWFDGIEREKEFFFIDFKTTIKIWAWNL